MYMYLLLKLLIDPALDNKYLILLENLRKIKSKTNFQLSKWKTYIHRKEINISFLKHKQRRLDCKIKAIVETIYDLKYIITCIREVL